MDVMLLMTVVSASAMTDLAKNKVYNEWVLVGIFSGLAIRIFREGPGGIITFLVAVGTALIILWPVYFLLRGIGAGDVKLFLAIAAFMDQRAIICCIVSSFLIGAIVSVVVILTTGAKVRTIHFAVPILISVLFHVWGINIV